MSLQIAQIAELIAKNPITTVLAIIGLYMLLHGEISFHYPRGGKKR